MPEIRVLLIEDDSSFVYQVERWLNKAEFPIFDFDSIESLQKAEVTLTRENFDIIITDLSLKNGEGLSTLTYLKSITELPIVVLTGSVRTEEERESLYRHSTKVLFKDDVVKEPSKLITVLLGVFLEIQESELIYFKNKYLILESINTEKLSFSNKVKKFFKGFIKLGRWIVEAFTS